MNSDRIIIRYNIKQQPTQGKVVQVCKALKIGKSYICKSQAKSARRVPSQGVRLLVEYFKRVNTLKLIAVAFVVLRL
jgi:hypothetical protein